MLPRLISEHQGAFFKGKHIDDGVLDSGELIDARLKSKSPGILCKLDIEKAFDNVNCPCMDTILQDTGFGVIWRKWIKWSLSYSQSSVLLNGTSTTKFKHFKGRRQGDSMSPFPFLLVAEIFTKLLKRDAQLNMITSFQVGDSLQVSHLQFADDTLVFLDA
ncbi:uncharacterized protein LOC113335720 [Papaver somniferum]|uniref:uncharacterized protein LOC113335720 n=1 Tax=Papaver somniferum TaxID=3469 RepID=UPI000E6FE8AA|nr:uncharacterized protein LOC113335720 [Papaver somniferum]